MIKCVYVAMRNNIVFDVSLIDYDVQVMNRKFNSIVKKRGTIDFDVKHFPVSGHNLKLSVFKRLLAFKNVDNSLDWLVGELEKECK